MQAIIFDFDGVVVDTEALRFKAIQTVAQKKGLKLLDAQFPRMVGKKTTFFLKETFPNLSEEELMAIAHARREEEYIHLDTVNLIEGIPELFSFLKEQKKVIAITTGSHKKIVDGLLTRHNLAEYPNTVITGEDFQTSKPDPECYLKTIEKLDISAQECIVIEDAPAGVESAKKAGCQVWGITTYVTKEQLAKADKVFDSHKEILEYIKKNV